MKITFVLPLCYSNPSGGFRIVYEYADRLAQRGHDVCIYYGCMNEATDKASPGLLDWMFFCIRNDFPKLVHPEWFKFSGAVQNYIVPEISDRFVRNSDAVIATAWPTAYSIKGLSPDKGEKYYLIQHHETVMSMGFEEDFVNATYRFGFHNIVISKWLGEVMQDIGAQARAYIPNGVDLQYFKVTKPIEMRNPFSVFMLWHGADWKGVKEGFRALDLVKQRCPALVLHLFGTSDAPEGLPDWVDYTCSPSREELCELYNAHAIFISPSWLEGFGLPGAEAQACGCALVTTDSKGVRDYAIDGETALMSPPKDVEALAKNILRFVEDTSYRIAIAKQGNAYVQRFNWEAAVNKMEALFQSKQFTLQTLLPAILEQGISDEICQQLKRYEAEWIIQDLQTLKVNTTVQIDLFNAIAVKFYENQYFDDILPFLSAALTLDTEDDVTLGNLGFILYQFGEKNLAKEYLGKIRNKDENIYAMLKS